MRRYLVAALAVASIAGVGTIRAQAPANPPSASGAIVKADHPGRTIFERQCATCHGAGPGDDGAPRLPGTMALGMKHEGRLPAELELRTDLDANALGYFVRNGSGTMPSFRKAELSDGDIDAIAGYLKATAQANGRGAD